MGFEAFKELWSRRDAQGRRKYDVVLLQRPSAKNKALFKPYELESGIEPCRGKGVVEGGGFKIVWGDATDPGDLEEACRGVDWILCPMAFISPAADRDPAMAKAVNADAIKAMIETVEAQPDGPERVRFVQVGTVAATGDRLGEIHVGRVGDPLKPSVFDFYATTKIAGERAILESNIRRWVVLRQTFIMIPDLMSLQDPILFHQPLATFMENNTARDAGRGLVNCLDVPDDSDFWRRVYNMGGGPSCRITFYEFLKRIYGMLGVDHRKVMERRWFALRNFHMQYFEDSAVLNEYLHNWGDTMEDYFRQVWKALPWHLKLVAKLNGLLPPLRWAVERATRRRLEALARAPEGTLRWYESRNDARITAFYGSYEAYEDIPGWDDDPPPAPEREPAWRRLDHGYDETKETLDLGDLKKAAEFRGGRCEANAWSGDLYERVAWSCARGHRFEARPYTILKAGHWCPECAPPPWRYDEEARLNPFFAQVWYPNHSRDEDNFYPEDCFKDVLDP
ncbi:MAG: NAD(P)-dependent oxidoreductase [Promethearchaeota archaeon]